MQQELTIGAAQKLSSPNPFALLSVKKPDGTLNVMAVSWWNYVSNHPASLAVCLSKKGYSGECILREGKFTLSLPGEALAEAAFKCGTCSGRDRDKAAEFGVPLAQHEKFPAGLVRGSRLNFACTLSHTCEAGDHVLYVAQVDTILGDENVQALYAMNGYGRLAAVQE